jgi:hypothetical protein
MARPKIKISPRHHSGKLKPHEHTSYGLLAVILFIAAFPLMYYTAEAATPYTGPEAGSIGLSGTVVGKPPTIAAQITAPPNGQHFSTSPVTIAGTCPKETLVEVFKNDIFAGSTACTTTGSFTIDIDLLFGQNTLIARVYDALNQAGPDSNTVVVYYDVLPGQASAINSLDFGGPQLLLNTDAVFRGSFPNQEMSMPIDIIGGTPPYAINIQWGDANNKVVSRSDNTAFKIGHAYQKAGTYQITIQGSDGNGRVAFLTVASIINGQPDVAVTATTAKTDTLSKLVLLWPLYTSTVAILVSFWLGERREKSLLAKRGQLLAS